MYVTLYDAGTAQFTIHVDFNTNNISFKRGSVSGTAIGNWVGMAAASFDHFQFKIKIDNSTGYVLGRKNGSTSDDYSLTSVDTQATANASADQIGLGTEAIGNWCYFDDFLAFSDNGSAPNDWVGDIRCWTSLATLDTAQKDFSAITPLITNLVNIGQTVTGSTIAITAGEVVVGKTWSNNQGGTFTQAAVNFSGGFTGNAKIALYLGDGNTRGWDSSQSSNPGAKAGHLLAVSNVLVNPVNGVNLFTFPGTVSLMNGWSYTIGLLTDTNCTVVSGNTTGLDNYFKYVNPGGYADGFPDDMGPIYVEVSSGSSPTFYIPAIVTSNAGMTSDRSPDELTTYVYDNVVGNYDLYDLIDIPYTPTAIIGMQMHARMTKTDSGARGAKIAALSAVTAFETAEFEPTTAFLYYSSSFYNNDPDTGSPWTAAAINALQIGPKVSS